ncbi:quercetin dioxygenase-like cupin family protein [Pullulanibacillus pueri]|uniref:Cupin type-1 domain-containing protein n=1 Tax=Pullulanibacillus pueri TaxID=1437324 RepID=A0A8J3EJU9_9BACL|nr:cupin domain-containing protein [Pullulanibacillus pueri]MBM7679946.1 quercetin dioxygenase-like cupin family protein [Pullulanibacillus pueri]GGH73617.1 hypothetical protein GCM10007096_01020 [Pullulanibacillus pueri]
MSQELTSPSLTLFADANQTVNYRRDTHNYITQVFAQELPAIRTGLFNVHMSQGIIIQPHWHTNVTELVFLIHGEVITSVFNPFTQQLMTYHLKPGQVSEFPKGWFHWIVALTNDVHLLTLFDQPTPDIVYGSDFLRFTPKEIMHLAYCINMEEYEQAIAPVKESLILGPPPGCQSNAPYQQLSINPNQATSPSAYPTQTNTAYYTNYQTPPQSNHYRPYPYSY